jgi:hypothetical protein
MAIELGARNKLDAKIRGSVTFFTVNSLKVSEFKYILYL